MAASVLTAWWKCTKCEVEGRNAVKNRRQAVRCWNCETSADVIVRGYTMEYPRPKSRLTR